MIRLDFSLIEYGWDSRGTREFVKLNIFRNDEITPYVMSTEETGTYQFHYKSEGRDPDYDSITLVPTPILVGRSVIECYPFYLDNSSQPQHTPKWNLYRKATVKLVNWDTWTTTQDGTTKIIRNNCEEGPNHLYVRWNGEIVEAGLVLGTKVISSIRPECYTPEGRWLPEFEYLIRERDFSAISA